MSDTMHCREFVDTLDRLLEGRIGGELRERLLRHRDTCESCAGLYGALVEPAPQVDLSAAILARTSGDPCASAHGRLGDLVDDTLDPIERQLVEGHLGGCSDCTALTAVLRRLAVDLPRLAVAPLDRTFTSEVLERTSVRAARAAIRWQRWLDGFRQLLARPRLALEGAYVLTAVTLLVFGIPTTPFAGVSRRAVTGVHEPMAVVEQQVTSGIREAWTQVEVGIADASTRWPQEIEQVSNEALQAARVNAGTFWQRLASLRATDDESRADDDATPEDVEDTAEPSEGDRGR